MASDAGIKLIVGLGNPGPKYDQTRHNAGFWFVDAIARKYGGHLKPETKFLGDAGRINVGGMDLWLLKPCTFMNRSGQAVTKLAKFYKIPTSQILVAHDELSFEPGQVRLKTGGGHAGHNGLRDIIAHSGGEKNFHRLRIGIGHPGASHLVSDYVLHKVGGEDRRLIEEAIDHSVNIISLLVEGELQKAFHRLHSE